MSLLDDAVGAYLKVQSAKAIGRELDSPKSKPESAAVKTPELPVETAARSPVKNPSMIQGVPNAVVFGGLGLLGVGVLIIAAKS